MIGSIDGKLDLFVYLEGNDRENLGRAALQGTAYKYAANQKVPLFLAVNNENLTGYLTGALLKRYDTACDIVIPWQLFEDTEKNGIVTVKYRGGLEMSEFHLVDVKKLRPIERLGYTQLTLLLSR